MARYACPWAPPPAAAAVASNTCSVVRLSARSDGNTRESSALNVAPAPRSVRGAIVTLTTRDVPGKRPNGTTPSESFTSVIARSAANLAMARLALSPTTVRNACTSVKR